MGWFWLKLNLFLFNLVANLRDPVQPSYAPDSQDHIKIKSVINWKLLNSFVYISYKNLKSNLNWFNIVLKGLRKLWPKESCKSCTLFQFQTRRSVWRLDYPSNCIFIPRVNLVSLLRETHLRNFREAFFHLEWIYFNNIWIAAECQCHFHISQVALIIAFPLLHIQL